MPAWSYEEIELLDMAKGEMDRRHALGQAFNWGDVATFMNGRMNGIGEGRIYTARSVYNRYQKFQNELREAAANGTNLAFPLNPNLRRPAPAQHYPSVPPPPIAAPIHPLNNNLPAIPSQNDVNGRQDQGFGVLLDGNGVPQNPSIASPMIAGLSHHPIYNQGPHGQPANNETGYTYTVVWNSHEVTFEIGDSLALHHTSAENVLDEAFGKHLDGEGEEDEL